MTTRPLPRFDVAAPNITQTRQTAIDKIRDNNLVHYINAALYGGIGWSAPTYTYVADNATQAVTINADNAVRVRAQYTYYTSGASNGLLHTATLSYSEDGGATWRNIGTQTYTYTTDGNLLSAAWVYA
ncbi:MAG: hypothetical protein FWC38_00635 [Proteobacteria bacterium]|nr:hypothetical protein [Pseudomonadota bacterium]MCL2306748.1 hypothetical protein [Pseudomonadota bacterium]